MKYLLTEACVMQLKAPEKLLNAPCGAIVLSTVFQREELTLRFNF